MSKNGQKKSLKAYQKKMVVFYKIKTERQKGKFHPYSTFPNKKSPTTFCHHDYLKPHLQNKKYVIFIH